MVPVLSSKWPVWRSRLSQLIIDKNFTFKKVKSKSCCLTKYWSDIAIFQFLSCLCILMWNNCCSARCSSVRYQLYAHSAWKSLSTRQILAAESQSWQSLIWKPHTQPQVEQHSLIWLRTSVISACASTSRCKYIWPLFWGPDLQCRWAETEHPTILEAAWTNHLIYFLVSLLQILDIV